MKVKICGITDVDTALHAASCGADAIGFVFAKSKRRIELSAAREISEQLPQYIDRIGVFVNEEKERIEEIIAEAKLTMIQLHGDESPEFCNTFSVPVVKALSINSEQDLLEVDQYQCEFILLDSPIGKYRGGNGIVFDWDLLSGSYFKDKKLILAGGLNEKNVEDAINIVHPYMVDVSSGVETNGRKDHKKIRRFIDIAKKGAKFEEELTNGDLYTT